MKFEIKYKPKSIAEVVFNNAENERKLKLIFRGYRTGNLFLSGANGTGKTLIANLIVDHLTEHCPVLHLQDSIEEVMAQDDLRTYFINQLHLAQLAGATNTDRVVIVFNELDKYEKPLHRLWTAMDSLNDELLVIITTNNPMKLDNAIRSRCAKYHFTRITPDDFVHRAQIILHQEQIYLPNSDVLYYLENLSVTTSDVRDYHNVLEDLAFSYANNLPFPVVPVSQPKQPALTILK